MTGAFVEIGVRLRVLCRIASEALLAVDRLQVIVDGRVDVFAESVDPVLDPVSRRAHGELGEVQRLIEGVLDDLGRSLDVVPGEEELQPVVELLEGDLELVPDALDDVERLLEELDRRIDELFDAVDDEAEDDADLVDEAGERVHDRRDDELLETVHDLADPALERVPHVAPDVREPPSGSGRGEPHLDERLRFGSREVDAARRAGAEVDLPVLLLDLSRIDSEVRARVAAAYVPETRGRSVQRQIPRVAVVLRLVAERHRLLHDPREVVGILVRTVHAVEQVLSVARLRVEHVRLRRGAHLCLQRRVRLDDDAIPVVHEVGIDRVARRRERGRHTVDHDHARGVRLNEKRRELVGDVAEAVDSNADEVRGPDRDRRVRLDQPRVVEDGELYAVGGDGNQLGRRAQRDLVVVPLCRVGVLPEPIEPIFARHAVRLGVPETVLSDREDRARYRIPEREERVPARDLAGAVRPLLRVVEQAVAADREDLQKPARVDHGVNAGERRARIELHPVLELDPAAARVLLLLLLPEPEVDVDGEDVQEVVGVLDDRDRDGLERAELREVGEAIVRLGEEHRVVEPDRVERPLWAVRTHRDPAHLGVLAAALRGLDRNPGRRRPRFVGAQEARRDLAGLQDDVRVDVREVLDGEELPDLGSVLLRLRDLLHVPLLGRIVDAQRQDPVVVEPEDVRRVGAELGRRIDAQLRRDDAEVLFDPRGRCGALRTNS